MIRRFGRTLWTSIALCSLALATPALAADVPSQNDLIFEKILHRLFIEGFPFRQAIQELQKSMRFDRWMKEGKGSFGSLAQGSARLDGGLENQLAFVNREEDFSTIARMTIGYCWGHATVTRKFAHFATFSGTGGEALLRTERGRALVQSWIDSVLANRPTRIEGFPNLYEFSRHPQVEDLLKHSVVKVWTDLAVSFRAIRAYATNLGRMRGPAFESFYKRVADRLSQNQKPKLYLVRQANPTGAHILLVNRIETGPHGQKVMCLLDNVVEPIENATCQARFELESDGTLTYFKPHQEPAVIRTAGFVPEEKSEVISITDSLKKLARK